MEVKTDARCSQVQQFVFQATKTPLPVNSFEPRRAPMDVVRPDGIRYVSEISYESKYPNGFMDIFYCPEPGLHPTIFNWHGGGFLFGDKASGDPLATKEDVEGGLLARLVREGYNVVTLNYAFAPEYRYPIQLHQVNEALAFCLAHAEELGLDMERVFLMGGSAGAVFTEIYGLAVVDADYAAKLGFEAALPEHNLRGLIINEAPTNYKEFDNEDMYTMFFTWLGVNDLSECTHAVPLDVPKCIKDRYPPACIIASNLEHYFPESAQQLADALEAIGGDYVHFYRPESVEKLEHGFINRFAASKCAAEAVEMVVQFLRSHTQGN